MYFILILVAALFIYFIGSSTYNSLAIVINTIKQSFTALLIVCALMGLSYLAGYLA
jgi:hypothetical protein